MSFTQRVVVEIKSLKCFTGLKTLNGNLVSEINECYLFHGTKTDCVDAIENKGFDFRISSDNAMFGKGVYFAESSTKADQYVGMLGDCSTVKKGTESFY